MNYWTELSIEYANQRSYLDDLFQVYPTIPEGIREINNEHWANIEKAFKKKNNEALIKELLKLDLFPIKDKHILKETLLPLREIPKQLIAFAEDFMKWDLTKFLSVAANPKKPIDKSDHFSDVG
jgi:hypothetical protein